LSIQILTLTVFSPKIQDLTGFNTLFEALKEQNPEDLSFKVLLACLPAQLGWCQWGRELVSSEEVDGYDLLRDDS